MTIFEKAISLIAPPDCLGCGVEGNVLCEACIASEIMPFGERCWRCNRLSLGAKTCLSCKSFRGPTTVWINTEYQGLVKEVTKSYKFGHLRACAEPMASLMAQTLYGYNNDVQIHRRNYMVVPVPTAVRRRRQRGFDHAQLLAKYLAIKLETKSANAVGRLGRERQVGATRSVRLTQPAGNYFAKQEKLITNRNILLIDDVVTTGATLREIARVLRRSGAKRVDALVFAKRL